MLENEFKKFNYSVIGSGTELEGSLRLKGDTIIAGHIKGDIQILDSGNLVIERDAVVEGDIYAATIEVFGDVVGSINTSGLLTARSSSSISGKVVASELIVYPGATINIEGVINNKAELSQETTDNP